MAAPATLRVEGYQSFMRAIAKADKDQRRGVRETLRTVGNIVRVEASSRIAGKNPRTASGFRTRVRQRGIAVEQSIRKTTGAHPEWGAYQMRNALLPALMSNADTTERMMEQALDRIADQFNHGTVV
jgi:hypothetical protein